MPLQSTFFLPSFNLAADATSRFLETQAKKRERAHNNTRQWNKYKFSQTVGLGRETRKLFRRVGFFGCCRAFSTSHRHARLLCRPRRFEGNVNESNKKTRRKTEGNKRTVSVEEYGKQVKKVLFLSLSLSLPILIIPSAFQSILTFDGVWVHRVYIRVLKKD